MPTTRTFTWMILTITLAGSFGCAICCGPDDYNYADYGGLHPRADMRHGRVGSVFSDPGSSALRLTPHAEDGVAYTPQEIERKPRRNVEPLPRPDAEPLEEPRELETGVNVRYRRSPQQAYPSNAPTPATPRVLPPRRTGSPTQLNQSQNYAPAQPGNPGHAIRRMASQPLRQLWGGRRR